MKSLWDFEVEKIIKMGYTLIEANTDSQTVVLFFCSPVSIFVPAALYYAAEGGVLILKNSHLPLTYYISALPEEHVFSATTFSLLYVGLARFIKKNFLHHHLANPSPCR